MTANASDTRSKRRPLRLLIFVAIASVLVPFTLWAVAALYLKEQCHINARARAADKATDFSGLIRQGVPGTTP